MKLIDAHQHFWQLSRADCDWPGADLGAIYRDFMPEDYREQAPSYIEKTVLVQSQPNDSDSDFLLELAAKNCFIGAVVTWLDFESEVAIARLDRLSEHPSFRGVRPMLQAIADAEWILQPRFEPVFAALCERGLRFDALIQPRHIGVIERLAQRWPELAIVVDHAAKPNIAEREYEQWADDIEALAQHPQLHCKFSGLVTEARPEQCSDIAEFNPYVERLLDCFGAQRLIWGSDWPVVNLRMSFSEWLGVAQRLLSLAGLDEAEQEQLFYTNARRFYAIAA